MQREFIWDLLKDFKMKKLFWMIMFIVPLLLSCKKRLDSFLYNGDDSIAAYLLDDYQGEKALDLPAGYSIPEQDIHLFHFPIQDEGKTLQIYAIYVGDFSSIATDTVILYCHGNKDHMDHYWPRQKLLSYVGGKERFGVLMFDYPGYGLSEGMTTEKNMYESTGGAIKWLKEKGLTNDRFVIYGYSLGSAPASKAVGDKPFVLQPNKIVLESPIASTDAMTQDASLLNMPSTYFANSKVNNVDQMKKCTVPLYWMHGIDDDFVSLETEGRLVYNAHVNSWKTNQLIQGAGHNNVPTFMGLEVYKQKLLQFIQKNN